MESIFIHNSDKLKNKEVIIYDDFVKRENALIEELKCCGNCKYNCEVPTRNLPEVRCVGLDQWEQIK